jgi:hypothetical protein
LGVFVAGQVDTAGFSHDRQAGECGQLIRRRIGHPRNFRGPELNSQRATIQGELRAIGKLFSREDRRPRGNEAGNQDTEAQGEGEMFFHGMKVQVLILANNITDSQQIFGGTWPDQKIRRIFNFAASAQ